MGNDLKKCPEIPVIIIYNPRGNYKPISFRFKNKETDEFYSPEPDDQIYFTLKKNYNTNAIVFQKSLDNGLIFDPETHYFSMNFKYEDTVDLDFDKFVGDITIVRKNFAPETEAYVEFYNCVDATSRSIKVINNE